MVLPSPPPPPPAPPPAATPVLFTITNKRVVRFALIAVLSFSLGRTWSRFSRLSPSQDEVPLQQYAYESTDIKKATTGSGGALDLDDQMDAQTKIQREIQSMLVAQNSAIKELNVCNTPRLMVSQLEQPKDGFASEFQYMSRLLQISVSTQRILVVTPDWRSAYEPSGCRNNSAIAGGSFNSHQHVVASGWDCLWEPLPVCSPGQLEHQQQQNQKLEPPREITQLEESPLMVGVLPQKATRTFFDVAWYSNSAALNQENNNNIMSAPISFPRRSEGVNLRPDILPHWERAYGRYWVRAQMAHALWKPNPWLQADIDQRLPSSIIYDKKQETHPTNELFIGFHIRLTDNVRDLQRHFARNATVTRSFTRFMEFAEKIRAIHYATVASEIKSRNSDEEARKLSYIYLATDNQDVLQQSQDPKWKALGWTFVTQNNVQRSSAGDERMWFREGRGNAAGAIATDIEVLRRADYLVGSFQSNVYRLACQLNTAWNTNKYPWERERHWTVDVEWYEDP